jgi:hypothetical protein
MRDARVALNVERMKADLDAGPGESGTRRFAFLLIPRSKDDLDPDLCQLPADLETDAPIGARDHRNPSDLSRGLPFSSRRRR